jgi:hypothetical protein
MVVVLSRHVGHSALGAVSYVESFLHRTFRYSDGPLSMPYSGFVQT